MDIVLLSRLQFAITTVYHFLFVPVTLGLSIFTALLETWYVNCGSYEKRLKIKKLVKFFGTIFLINFAMGVVTGIVQEFHFGMNWSEYARFMGDIFGAPLALEALTAFFLESTFLGIWMFGWDKLSEKQHCICIWLVAFGSNLSAFWILVANSFMQHPVGYAVEGGRAVMTDFIALVTNPYVIGEYSHALFAGLSTGGFIAIAVCAWKILNDEESRDAFTRVMKLAVVYTMIGLLGVMGSGHFHAQRLAELNPMKLASFEALWETEDPAPFAVYADINKEMGRNDSEFLIPYMFSFMVHNSFHGEVRGINDLQREAMEKYGNGNYIPDVKGMFWSFRTMISVGGLMLFVVFITAVFAFFIISEDSPKKLSSPSPMWSPESYWSPSYIWLKLLPFLVPLPFIANSVGWYIVEAGRQPWIVVGLQRTAQAVSPNLSTGEVWLTMIGFTAIYLLLAIVALFTALRFIRRTKVTEQTD
ncbi:MAG: cytochrome ubiquinol oxidase subunit I [Selenomonadaceae bacterium]|nr:cytochrome ubiquinol oxidase subunit I [Selenomonadaceae bacterium]